MVVRIDSLQSLRFALIFMVVWVHSMLPQSQTWHDFGEFAVSAFFVLSGFVLSLDKGRKLADGTASAGRFFLSCVSRLFPLHLAVLAVTLLLDWRLGIEHTAGSVAAHALLLQSWSMGDIFVGGLNAPSWFLSDILFFYLVYPFLYRWQAVRRWTAVLPLTFIYIALCVSVALTEQDDCSAGYVFAHPLFRIVDFFLGVLLCRVYRSLHARFSGMKVTAFRAHVADCAVPVLLSGLYALSAVCTPNLRCAALYWLPSSILILYVACTDAGKGWLQRLLHTKAMVWLGGISFEIYMCHDFCLRVVRSMFVRLYDGSLPSPWLEFAAVLAFTVFVSWAAKSAFSRLRIRG